jgi:hypothetical protein
VRSRIAIGGIAAALSLAAAGAYAAGNVITPTNLSVSPKRFCPKSSDTCSHPGTTLHFRLATPAKVIADTRPRNQEKSRLWGFHVFTQRFSAGAHAVRINDTRFSATTGRWTLTLRAVNSVGAGGPAPIDVNVFK